MPWFFACALIIVMTEFSGPITTLSTTQKEQRKKHLHLVITHLHHIHYRDLKVKISSVHYCTWERLIVGEFPLQQYWRSPDVDPTLETGWLTLLHHGTVWLNGDNGGLITYSKIKPKQSVIRHKILESTLFIWQVPIWLADLTWK